MGPRSGRNRRIPRSDRFCDPKKKKKTLFVFSCVLYGVKYPTSFSLRIYFQISSFTGVVFSSVDYNIEFFDLFHI